MKCKAAKQHGQLFHFLITSLFYPAVLGSLFYSLLDNCFNSSANLNSFYTIMASLGIVATFSIDYIYTYISKHHYTTTLFVFDLIVLFFLFIGYQNLIQAITHRSSIYLFFISFIIMHTIFFCWDVFFVPKDSVPKKIILYDVVGFVLATVGLCVFNDNAIYGVLFLWIYVYLSIKMIGEDLLKVVSVHYK